MHQIFSIGFRYDFFLFQIRLCFVSICFIRFQDMFLVKFILLLQICFLLCFKYFQFSFKQFLFCFTLISDRFCFKHICGEVYDIRFVFIFETILFFFIYVFCFVLSIFFSFTIFQFYFRYDFLQLLLYFRWDHISDTFLLPFEMFCVFKSHCNIGLPYDHRS